MNWDREILELEEFFSNRQLPEGIIELNPWTKIINVNLFVESSLATIKRNNGNEHYLPYLKRLQQLKQHLNT